MSDPDSRRGRVHDAEGARQALLDAAEAVFAEHGFDGARVDAIAAAAGYNKSLIFQYFDDKLGLYAAVIRRIDEQTRAPQVETLAALLDDAVLSDRDRLEALVRQFTRGYLDYLIAHPRIVRIFLWEMAEGWETYAKVLTQSDRDDVDQFAPVLRKLRATGLLRPGLDPMVQFVGIEFLGPCFLACLPLCQILLPGQDLSAPETLARVRDYVVELTVRGLLADRAARPARQRAPAKKRSGIG